MQLAEADTELFFTIVPAFIGALPPSPEREPSATHPRHRQSEERNQVIRDNAITFLRFEIQELPRVLTRDCAIYDLSDDAFSKASVALEDILFLLDELVDHAILEQESDVPPQKYSKLQALETRLSRRDQTPTINTSIHFPDKLKYPAEGALAAQYRKIAYSVQQFNRTMRTVYENYIVNAELETAHVEATQIYHQYCHDEEDRKRAQRDIRQAQRLCETTKAIVKVFANIPQPCRPPHSAHIHLSGFEEPQIDMLVSVCGENKSEKWHIVHWANASDQNPRQTSTNTFCSVLKESHKRMTRLRVQLRRDASWNEACARITDRIKTHAAAPKLTLEKWLEHAKKNGQKNPAAPRLTKKDILHLALTIARSLLYLLGSPLLQDPWKTDTIYLEQTTDGWLDKGFQIKPYTSVQLTGCLGEDYLGEECKQSNGAKSSILHFGLLLTELFFSKKVTVTEEDIENDEDGDETDSLFNALNRDLISLRDFKFDDPYFLDIIDHCLNLYCQAEVINAAFRTNLYWRIVKPLMDSLENYNPSRGPAATGKREGAPPPLHHIPNNRSVDQRQALVEPIAVKAAGSTVPHLQNMSESPESLTDATLLGSQGKITDSNSWLNRFDLVNERLKALAKAETRAVRVAVLDTGCDLEHKFFSGPGIRQDKRLEGHWFDCLGESPEPVDEDPDRHGTSMVALLLRLLPNAEVYVVRVARNAEGLFTAKQSIAHAICHTVRKEWDIDIVSMSFGFPHEVTPIREAIVDAQRLKHDKILFFAAANNDGPNSQEMFPAFFESVISVRGTKFDGSFDSQYDPQPWSHKGEIMYGTLGKDVACGWTAGSLVKSGCSVATPIMAAIAATIIWFVACPANGFSEKARGEIQTRRGILSVFDVMSEKQKSTKRSLEPWQLFKDGKGSMVENVEVSVRHALNKLPEIE